MRSLCQKSVCRPSQNRTWIARLYLPDVPIASTIKEAASSHVPHIVDADHDARSGGSVSNQRGTSNQSATVWRCTTSTPSSSADPGGHNSRRVPCQGSVEKETYARRITRSNKTLPVCADGEFLQSTWLSIPCPANAVERSAAYS